MAMAHKACDIGLVKRNKDAAAAFFLKKKSGASFILELWDRGKAMRKPEAKAMLKDKEAHFGDSMELLLLKTLNLQSVYNSTKVVSFSGVGGWRWGDIKGPGRLLGNCHRTRHTC